MKSDKPALLIVTNLYPLPWEPNRATFNRQQFSQLEEDYALYFLIPVPLPVWWKHRHDIPLQDNIRIVPQLYIPKFGRRFYGLLMWWSLRLFAGTWLEHINPDKILASWAYPDAVAANKIAHWLNTPFYFKVHGSDINMHGTVPARARQIVSMSRSARGILSVSKALKSAMVSLGIQENKIHTIYNGVNHDLFSSPAASPLDERYVLYVGNLKHDKGVMELLRGFAALADAQPDLHLVYAGNGPMKAEIEAWCAATPSLNGRVTLLGQVNHAALPAWIQHATALALPSYNEGVPNVVLEAMACGTPVLATRVGGIPEVLPGDCGVLIDPRSDEAVTQGLAELLQTTWNSDTIKTHAQRFTWSRNREQLLQLLSL
ncbi:glycosyltransferase [Alteromonas sp. CYL-A6]|uniref:glycosyltransferase n=1 Tax=Alteromonas nitratireducens TaxID=3390813 RepID=UPI0034C3A7DC